MDKLSQSTIQELREAFALFDKNSDGKITFEELGTVMRSMGQNPSDNELRSMVREVDVDGNGTIEFDEFVRLMAGNLNGEARDAEMKEAFNVFDRDGNGRISRDELRAVMNSLGESMNNEELDRMIGEADKNGDGEIDWDEFRHMFDVLNSSTRSMKQ
uniref:EF-hand domain-containing protein n=1 Tax=Timspurckia oligopyrenoides TaxID=708627 RepID=A0A7S0ZKG0_9RHOD|mmetsp:Transcript_8608/g.15567  ORF Transcript_8608/g.15567 Transcript_8608/m.15567 type:complete len:158 (+) Transcript_8608:89-562(+)|eukprot:CAMPEP_0182442542 /NCGR_PEP_ID=MMETSP1172-20130603/1455_1 /TAXON_ID=708627 /ORGANISM="Timspurckia oligopyrenoides, Strain CCMP3278" /LENGTH=157 /DNA_ID=CAMNT_0024637461 /DNA_START=20 /DNA_END=493 /DNA_ORIENTATION=+